MTDNNSWLEHPLFQAISEHPLVQEYQKTVSEPILQSMHNLKIYQPSDIYWIDGHLQIKIDMPGFDVKDITTKLRGNILTVSAERESIKDMMENAKKDIKMIVAHRPLKFYAILHLPFEVKDNQDKPKISEKNHVLVNGILTIDIVNVKEDQVQTCKPNQ